VAVGRAAGANAAAPATHVAANADRSISVMSFDERNPVIFLRETTRKVFNEYINIAVEYFSYYID
jgi:hypothetical protein